MLQFYISLCSGAQKKKAGVWTDFPVSFLYTHVQKLINKKEYKKGGKHKIIVNVYCFFVYILCIKSLHWSHADWSRVGQMTGPCKQFMHNGHGQTLLSVYTSLSPIWSAKQKTGCHFPPFFFCGTDQTWEVGRCKPAHLPVQSSAWNLIRLLVWKNPKYLMFI